MLAAERLPPPTRESGRCHGCSLRDRCQPQALGRLAALPDGDIFLTEDADEITGPPG